MARRAIARAHRVGHGRSPSAAHEHERFGERVVGAIAGAGERYGAGSGPRVKIALVTPVARDLLEGLPSLGDMRPDGLAARPNAQALAQALAAQRCGAQPPFALRLVESVFFEEQLPVSGLRFDPADGPPRSSGRDRA